MPRYAAPPRRGYREPERTGSAGSVLVFCLGLILMAAALGSGYLLHTRGELLGLGAGSSGSDGDDVVSVAQVCTEIAQYNTDYPKQITTKLQQGVDGTVNGNDAAGDKAVSEASALAKEWTGKLRSAAGHTDNTDLGAAITDLATKLGPLETGEASLNDMTQIVADGTTALAPYCPKAQ